MWPRCQSSPINTLFYKCLPFTNLDDRQCENSLPIQIKQEIFDYLICQKVKTSSSLICDLLQNGGIFSLDLWSIFNNNDFTEDQISEIFKVVSSNCFNLIELRIGGFNWIYNDRIVAGPFKSLLKSNLTRLKKLTLQQTSGFEELLNVFENCPNLVSLEICQPSLDCQDISNLEIKLNQSIFDQIRQNLKEIKVPSSFNSIGLVNLLSLLPNIERLQCRHFEEFLNILQNCNHFQFNVKLYEAIQKAIKVAGNLRSLSITHPLGDDIVYLLVKYCPLIEDLSLEVQKGMELSPIVQLKCLKRLELHNSQSMSISYLGQVLPLIEKIGSKLDALVLKHFDIIDLSSFAKNCPNLKVFSAEWFTTISFNRSIQTLGLSKAERSALQQTFSKLRYLRLRPRGQRQVPQDAVAYLLKNTLNLEYLELYCCYDLDDFHFLNIIKKNSFQNLKYLILRHEHGITKPCINTFVNSLNHLQYLNCCQPRVSKAQLVSNDNNNDNMN